MGLVNYIKNLIKPETAEPNPKGLSMAELCIKYLPQGSVDYSSGASEQLKNEALFFSYLTDEEMHTYLIRSYQLSDRKAKAFVRDSQGYRDIMKWSREVIADHTGKEDTEPLDVKVQKSLYGLSNEDLFEESPQK